MAEDNTRTPSLRSIYMYITGACNLRCSHCWIDPEFHADGCSNSLNIDPALVAKAVTQGKPLGLNKVKLTGGEPLLHPRFREIVEILSKAELGITIETNGTLVDENTATFLASTKGFGHISVSIDGVDAPTHDKFRGVPGSFDRAVEGIRHLVAAGLAPQMISVLHRGNISSARGIIDLAEKLKCGSIKFNPVQPIGRGADFSDDMFPSVREILKLNNIIEKDIVPSCGIPVMLSVPFAFYTPSRFLRGSPGRCTIGNIIGLLAGGDLALCGIGTSTKELVYGNIGRDDLADVWSNSPGLALLRESIPDRLEGICSECVHRNICLGYCVAMNYLDTGRLCSAFSFCSRADETGLFPDSRRS